uniref:Oxysterol-binding protein n=1 Tax=Macrostomum lignano TaxID=282301 RepID=A0A1I8ISZ3_9PLAT
MDLSTENFCKPLDSSSVDWDVGREELPAEMRRDGDGCNIWSVLKNCIGKELSRVSIPVGFNEPLSFLQRLSEQLEHSHLLYLAERCDSAVGRLELISAFTVACASSNWGRIWKPFNPLLGETFELDRSKDRGFRMVCEQVCHHPPISAFHAEATDGSWIFHGSVNPKLTFWGKSIEIEPRGDLTLEFPRRQEVFTWRNVSCKIHNVIVGKMWIESFGNSVILSHSNGYRAELNWHLASWRNPEHHRVDGYILDSSKTRLRALYGKWVDGFYSWSSVRGKSNPLLDMVGADQRDCETAGDADTAQSVKSRLEEWQRLRLQQQRQQQKSTSASASAGDSSSSEAGGGVWFRRWRNPYTKRDDDWQFTGEYWTRDWARCPLVCPDSAP